MSKLPETVSIIMATFNRGHLIEETLNSIRSQTYGYWECIIIDDGSEDKTEEVISSILKKDSRFKYFKRDEKYKKGLPGCRNKGLDLALGQYIVFFDDDDIVHPDNLKICTDILAYNDVDYCRYERKVFWGNFSQNFDKTRVYETSPLPSNVLTDMLTEKLPFNSCQVIWKKECFSKIRFCEELMYAEEWECYSRILLSGAVGINIHKVLFYGRKHAKSNTGEFKMKNPIRKKSHIKAVKMVISNLKRNNLFSDDLVHYFLKLGLQNREYGILIFTLRESEMGVSKEVLYRFGFFAYPLLKPFFQIKKKISRQ